MALSPRRYSIDGGGIDRCDPGTNRAKYLCIKEEGGGVGVPNRAVSFLLAI